MAQYLQISGQNIHFNHSCNSTHTQICIFCLIEGWMPTANTCKSSLLTMSYAIDIHEQTNCFNYQMLLPLLTAKSFTKCSIWSCLQTREASTASLHMLIHGLQRIDWVEYNYFLIELRRQLVNLDQSELQLYKMVGVNCFVHGTKKNVCSVAWKNLLHAVLYPYYIVCWTEIIFLRICHVTASLRWCRIHGNVAKFPYKNFRPKIICTMCVTLLEHSSTCGTLHGTEKISLH